MADGRSGALIWNVEDVFTFKLGENKRLKEKAITESGDADADMQEQLLLPVGIVQELRKQRCQPHRLLD